MFTAHRPIGWVCYLPVTCPAYAGLEPFHISFVIYCFYNLEKRFYHSQQPFQQINPFNICVSAVVENIIKKWLPASAKCYLPLWLCHCCRSQKCLTCPVTCHQLLVASGIVNNIVVNIYSNMSSMRLDSGQYMQKWGCYFVYTMPHHLNLHLLQIDRKNHH